MPEVSVVIPLYNRAELIRDAIDSVLTQTFEDYELIVVDDGSIDGSADSVLAYDDPRITLCRHERNKGLSAARNTGIERASGAYVALLDSDDLWRPNKLERQIAAMRTRQWHASCTWSSIKRLGRQEELRRIKQSADWFWKTLFTNSIPCNTVVVERACFEQVGLYDETLRFCEDIDWLLRFFHHGFFLEILEEDLSVTRRYDESSVAWKGDDPHAHYYELWTTQVDGRPKLTARELRRFKAGIETRQAQLFLRHRDYLSTVRHFARAIMLSPVSVATWFIDRIMVRMPAGLTRHSHR